MKKQHPNNLTIELGALTTRVLFEGTRAIGVEFLEGRHLYKADSASNGSAASARKRQVRAGREVILCAGAFNSPQLLMLSGVGPRDHLEQFGIPVVVDLPGVGRNLQDRYEVGVVSQFSRPFKLLENATFAPPSASGPARSVFLGMGERKRRHLCFQWRSDRNHQAFQAHKERPGPIHLRARRAISKGIFPVIQRLSNGFTTALRGPS